MVTFKVVQTCWACPEQYDVFLEDKQVGYLRLRHGYFRCDYPECGGETLFGSYTEGDGAFKEEERDPMISEAIAAIANKLEIRDNFTYEIEEEEDPFIYPDDEVFPT